MNKYAVIFRAEINQLDAEYSATATRLRELALSKYGCLEFVASSEGNLEIAISYWSALDHIRAWKSDPGHQQAQVLGKTKWYKSYSVQIVEVLNEYGNKDHA